jgi:hypothetical protein
MGVGTQVTMRVVVTTPLTVTLSLASKPEPPPLSGTLTSTLLWSGTSVVGLSHGFTPRMEVNDGAHPSSQFHRRYHIERRILNTKDESIEHKCWKHTE